MKNYKTLSDEALLSIIDSSKPNSKEFQELKDLSKTDQEFRIRMKNIQLENKNKASDSLTEFNDILLQLKDYMIIIDGYKFNLLYQQNQGTHLDDDVKIKIKETLDKVQNILEKSVLLKNK
jgi:hypothetical protein